MQPAPGEMADKPSDVSAGTAQSRRSYLPAHRLATSPPRPGDSGLSVCWRAQPRRCTAGY
ncbi:unnamed protein product [Prunus armeniaca]|uniref:Uncharacterized protein n=1 Tax=Prunus armeniaca TaxID=36596 RepID=A0A6J5WN00_PRUAR|nr:unnamed protein product [Prunus armeniaca]CAB4302969.1 unnamed protein product [Prunus armeniaca]